ncbi:MFS transporter [Staphylococcus sp. AS1337]|uniref:MFS transporter n=1 Tax=Staphylococcus sp. AS1337 TaxID=3434042 RepID=UPI003F552A85
MKAKKQTNLYILGMVLAILTFWLFAQSMINIIPTMQKDLKVSSGILNISTSLTSLFCGLFIVVGGGIADRIGRKRITYVGLIISIIGSLLIIAAREPVLLIFARILQGLSAALIMPATLALIKTTFEKSERQRALSYWSFGSWGGGGVTTFVGGLIATYFDWRLIFVLSIIVSAIAMVLLRTIEETKISKFNKKRFDVVGFSIFVLALLVINVIITQGQELGWFSITTIGLFITSIILALIFIFYEKSRKNQFIDLKLFKSKPFTGAVLTNFLQNGIAGTIVVANTYIQVARGYSAFETGLLTLGNIVALLLMIRVGEKMLQKFGPSKPMFLSIIIASIGMSSGALTFLPNFTYLVVVFIGFLIGGIGIGLYATPSIDTLLENVSDDKSGIGSGIYKMASSLGYSFGIAISTAIYSTFSVLIHDIHLAGAIGMLTPLTFGIISIIILISTMYEKSLKAKLT